MERPIAPAQARLVDADLCLLHVALRVDVLDAGMRGRNLCLRLLERDAIVAVIDAGDHVVRTEERGAWETFGAPDLEQFLGYPARKLGAQGIRQFEWGPNRWAANASRTLESRGWITAHFDSCLHPSTDLEDSPTPSSVCK